MSEITTLPDQARTYGAGYAAIYDDVFADGPDTERAVVAIRALLAGAAPDPAVVELGVGTGRIAIPLAEHGIDVIGLDSSPELLAVAAGKRRPHATNPTLIEADIREPQDLPSVDLVLCLCATFSMLLSPREQAATLRNAVAMLRPGGMLLIETHDPTHVRALHRKGVHRQLLEVGGGTIELTSRLLPGGDHWELTTAMAGDAVQPPVTEISRLVSPGELGKLATEAGLRHRFTWSSWAGDHYSRSSPMYIAGFVLDPASWSDSTADRKR